MDSAVDVTLKSCRLRQIDPEPVPSSLIASGHLGAGVAELLLDVALVDLGRGGEAGAQRVAGEQGRALGLGQVAAQAGGGGGALDQAGDLAVVEPHRPDRAALAGDAAKERPLADAREAQPGLQRLDRTAGRNGAGADLDLAPAGLAAQGDEQAAGQDLDPAAAVGGLIAAEVEPGDLGPPQPAGEPQKQHGPVAQAPEAAAVAGLQHGEQVLGQDRRLLARRCGVAVADAGQHGGDVAVAAVERQAALGIGPADRREPPLDGRDGVLAAADGSCPAGAGGDVEARDLRVGVQGVQPLAPAPGGEVFPVGGIGAAGVGGTGGLGIAAGALGQVAQGRGLMVGWGRGVTVVNHRGRRL